MIRNLLVSAGSALFAVPAGAQSPFINGTASIRLSDSIVDRRDVDGDGIPDLVFQGMNGNGMGYLPGRTGWGFGDAVQIAIGGAHIRAEIGFFDASKTLTLAFQSGTRMDFYQSMNGVTTLVGTDQPVPALVAVGVPPFQAVRQFMAGDLDGDGLTDLLYPTQNGFVVRWASRQPSGRYEQFNLGGPVFIFPIRDYDNDGFDDVLVHAQQHGGVIFYPGGPIGQLGAPRHTGLLISDVYSLILFATRIGRFDEGADLDFVSQEEYEAVFHLNFLTDHASVLAVPTQDRFWSAHYSVGDYDGDGWGDLFLNVQGSPVFSRRRTFLWLGPLSPHPELVEFEAHLPAETFAVVAEDVDADGLTDLVTFSARDVLALRTRSRHPASPTLGPSFGPANVAARHTLAVDLDGDGLPELLNASPLEVLNPRDLQQPPVALGITAGFMSLHMGAGPQGGVRIAHDGNALRILDFAPDGTLARTTTLPQPAPGSIIGLARGDFDSDGLEDLATVLSPSDAVATDEILIYRALADGEFEFFAAVPSEGAVKPAVGDFNGDGLADIFVGDRSARTARVLFNRGGGVFETASTWSNMPAYWFDALDIDGDGHTDVLGLVGSGIELPLKVSAAVWYGGPDGNFQNPLPIHFTDPLAEPAFGDLDGNGLVDLVFVRTAGLSTSGSGDAGFVYLQTAPRVFELRSKLPRADASGVAVDDLNGDGALDIVAVSGDQRKTRIFWGDPPECQADFNGDGQLNFFDLARFTQAFAATDPSADIAEPFGVWNFFDVSAFVQLFNQGCP